MTRVAGLRGPWRARSISRSSAATCPAACSTCSSHGVEGLRPGAHRFEHQHTRLRITRNRHGHGARIDAGRAERCAARRFHQAQVLRAVPAAASPLRRWAGAPRQRAAPPARATPAGLRFRCGDPAVARGRRGRQTLPGTWGHSTCWLLRRCSSWTHACAEGRYKRGATNDVRLFRPNLQNSPVRTARRPALSGSGCPARRFGGSVRAATTRRDFGLRGPWRRGRRYKRYRV